MAKPELRNQNLLGGENPAGRILAQGRIVDSCEHLRDLQRQMRRHARIFTELQRLPLIPDLGRELVAKLKKSNQTVADQIADIKENLEVACTLLNPPGLR